MERFLAVAHILGLVVMLFALTMLLPLGVALWYDDAALIAYDEAIFITGASGLLLWVTTRRHRRELQVRDGFLLVVLVWAGLPAFGTLPLLLSIPGLSFTDAYFEATSGLTASGGTVLSNLDRLPPSINIWRGEMVWLGGMGLIVLAVAILPMLGVGGRQMYKAETPGPMKDTRLTPRITETAKGLWLVYVALTAMCCFAYHLAGMSGFDALMHAFTTMGLGGFSSHDASFAYWDSPTIEAVAVAFMLVAGINFATHFLAWRGRSMRAYGQDPEAFLFLGIVAASCLIVAVYLLWKGVYPDFLAALRFATFNTVSVATTTGYANTDYGLWPIFAPLWIIFLSSFTTSSGSTGGGIKMIRAIVLYKQVYRELLKLMHPSVVSPVKVGGQPVPDNIIYAVLAFGFMYMAAIVSMTLIVAMTEDALTAVSAVIASINNLGPGLVKVGPASTFAVLSDFDTWVCSFAMLLGRLEIFTLLVVFTPHFWHK